MRGEISGQDVRGIRQALGLSVIQFATVLGVHPSSVHRWESAASTAVPIEGVAWTVMSALRARVLSSTKAEKLKAAAAGRRVSDELATGGVLMALAVLLYFAARRE